MSASEPICPYCGKEMSDPNPIMRSDFVWCVACGVRVLRKTAESRPFRVEWGSRTYARTVLPYSTRERAEQRVEMFMGAEDLVRRLVSEWEPDRG